MLARAFPTIETLQAATVEDLAAVDEIGEIIAQSVYEFLHSGSGEQTIDGLRAVGVQLDLAEADRVVVEAAAGAGILAGKSLVVTGTLTRYTRDEIQALIAQHGGRAASSISKSTDYLVAGEKAGSKLEKAQQLGVQVLSEADFEQLVTGSQP